VSEEYKFECPCGETTFILETCPNHFVGCIVHSEEATELDRLKAENAKLKEGQPSDLLEIEMARCEQLEKEISRLREALKYYSKPVFCGACLLTIERGDTAREALKGDGE